MDLEQLTAALGDPEHAPEPDMVLASFGAKRRKRRARRVRVSAGCAAIAAVIAVLAVVLPRLQGSPGAESGPSSAGAVAPGQHDGARAGAASGAAPLNRGTSSAGPNVPLAGVCGTVPLPQRLAAAATSDGSVVIADATVTGRAADGRTTVVLRDVRTLHGPRIASGGTAYAVPGLNVSSLRGQVFAILLPTAPGGHGESVLAAPVSGGTVEFATAGCWGTADTPLSTAEGLASGS